MKRFGTIIVALLCINAGAQIFTETLKREYQFEKPSSNNTFILANINGNIKVEGYSGDKILVEAIRTIKAKNSERLDRGKKEMQLNQIDRYDTIIFYVGGSCNKFNYQKIKRGEHRWGYNWDCDKADCNQSFDYKFDFTIKIPYSVNIEVSTVNDGNISVTDMKAGVTANNVNGAIQLSGLEGPTCAVTINGDVDLEYNKNPTSNCRYYTLNGDINANFQKGLVANLSFKSFNGEFFTNLESLTSLPMEIKKVEGEKGVHLKVAGSKYKIRQGGALLDFETFNGDAIVKEK
jgi:hypothetical protein